MSTVVVALVLFSLSSQKYLIVRRDQGQSGAGHWEFPGGKVESGESQTQALKREINEELSLSIDGARLTYLLTHQHQYSTKHITISFYLYPVLEEIPVRLIDHDQLNWCEVGDLLTFQMAEADLPVIELLKKMKESS